MQPNSDYISDVESIYNLLITKYDNVSLDDREILARRIKSSGKLAQTKSLRGGVFRSHILPKWPYSRLVN